MKQDPGQMENELSRCSCGALLPDQEGPTHRYLLSTAACWAGYGEVLAREYENPARWAAHRLCVDAYAAQHPGRDSQPSRQSVALHLSRLGLCFEYGWPAEQIDRAMPALLALKRTAEWLEPPVFEGLTFLHVSRAGSDEEHLAAVEQWARFVWESWKPRHGAVRRWLRTAQAKPHAAR